MVGSKWLIHWVFIGTILIAHRKSHCENAKPRETRAIHKEREKTLLNPVLTRSKKLLATIKNQFKLAVSKVPHLFGRSTTALPRHDDDDESEIASGVRGVYQNPGRSRQENAVPSSGTVAIVEVIDDSFGGNVAKRDEIDRPNGSKVKGSGSQVINATADKVEQALTEVYDDYEEEDDDGDYDFNNGKDEHSNVGRFNVHEMSKSGPGGIAKGMSDTVKESVGRNYGYRNNSDKQNNYLSDGNNNSSNNNSSSNNNNSNNSSNNSVNAKQYSNSGNKDNNGNIAREYNKYNDNHHYSNNSSNNNSNKRNTNLIVNENSDSISDEKPSVRQQLYDNYSDNVNYRINNNNSNTNDTDVSHNEHSRIDDNSNQYDDNAGVDVSSGKKLEHNNDDDDKRYNYSSVNSSNDVYSNNSDINDATEEGGISNEQFDKIKDTVEELLALETNNTKHNATVADIDHWSQWLTWSACSHTCGNGVRMRRRTCRLRLFVGSGSCPGASLETQRCRVRHCPVDGGYTEWTSWSSCSETCGKDSLQMRMRICMNPPSQYDGKDCPGSRFMIRYCTTSPCLDNLPAGKPNKDPSEKPKNTNGNETSEDNTDGVLENLKTILQMKTVNLEETLAAEPTKSASKIFDAIYQSGHYENTTGKTQNIHPPAQTTTKEVTSVSSTANNERVEEDVHSEQTDYTELLGLSTLVEKLQKVKNDSSDGKSSESSLLLNNNKSGNVGEVKNTTEKDEYEKSEQDRLLNHEKDAFSPRDHADNSSSKLKSVFRNVDEVIEEIGKEDKVETVGDIKHEPISSEFDKQNAILNARGSSDTNNGTFDKLDEENSDHSVMTTLEHALKTNAFRHESSRENITRKGTSILGKIINETDKETLVDEVESKEMSSEGYLNYDNFKNWTPWTACSKTCAGGYKMRNKTICLKSQQSGENDCSHWKIQKKLCSLKPCSETKTVGDIMTKHPVSHNESISEVTEVLPSDHLPKQETETLGVIRQELDADFLPWSAWSSCSSTCGQGVRSRKRICRGKRSPNCIGPRHGIAKCFLTHCLVNGAWSPWSDWTACSQTCGDSLRVRMRKCNSPTPLYGGTDCVGRSQQHFKCYVPPCVVNGRWSPWSGWSSCSHSCGDGSKAHTRACNNPAPSNGGSSCEGDTKEHLGCYLQACPVDGGFSHWHSWSKCQKTCGPNSFRTRFRFCNNPPPGDGGKTCHGGRLQLSNCHHEPCPVDGGLSHWTSWSACSETCGQTPVMSRERLCNNPAPFRGGKNCTGQTFQIRFCERKSCHKDTIKDAPPDKGEQQGTLVQTIIDEKEELLKGKKNRNPVDFSGLKKKLIENLKKLNSLDLNLPLRKTDEHKTSEVTTSDDARSGEVHTVRKIKVSDHDESEERSSSTVDKIFNNGKGGFNKKTTDKDDTRESQGKPKDTKVQSIDGSGQKDEKEEMNPIKLCGFNPCKIAKCLSDPFADCMPDKNCDPVYYDDAGNVKHECTVDATFLTVPTGRVCERDPCKTSVCMMLLPMAKCLTSALCHPVYFDETGSVLNCTGVLHTPVMQTCGGDPCVGKYCSSDPEAKCFTDFQCRSSFWNLNAKEEIMECKEPEKEKEDQENADDRSRTPSFSMTAHKKRLKRPWLRLSKAALADIIKNSPQNGIYYAHAKIKELRGRKKINHFQRLDDDEHDAKDDGKDDDDDDMTDDDNKAYESEDGGTSKTEKVPFSLPRIPSNKLRQLNNPQKNPILTLTSLNPEQYQNHGGNGVGVTKDWKLKLKPPIHLEGYVESPQVYKVNTLKEDEDQSAGDFLHHRKNDRGLSSEGLSSEGLTSEELSSEGLPSEGLPSEGLSSEGLPSEMLTSNRPSLKELSSEGLSSEGLRSEGSPFGGLSSGGLSSEGLSSVDTRALRRGDVQLNAGKSGLDGVQQYLRNDAPHQASEVTTISAQASLQPDVYNKVTKQDIGDIQSALDHIDDSIARGDGLSSLTSTGIGESSLGTTENLEKGAGLGLPDVDPIPSRDNLPRTGESREIIPNDPSSSYKEDEMSDTQGGRFVPLDNVIHDMRDDVLRRH